MSETPIDEQKDTFLRRAAEIAKNPTVYIPTLLTVAGLSMIGWSIGQNEQREENRETISQVGEKDRAFYDGIRSISEAPAILDSATLTFEVNGPSLYDQAHEEIDAANIPGFDESYEVNKDLIDSVLLESTKTLASHVPQPGDEVAVSELLVDNGTRIYVTQFVTEESHELTPYDWVDVLNEAYGVQQAAKNNDTSPPPAATELPTPETH